ncbi:MAG: carbamoyltransferase HypF [Anaerolineae bacterium]|nr:carbamoyltransferase HypF [Anaerolineae bacterium]
MRPNHLQDPVAQHIAVTGVVQGVGFRPFVYNLASRLMLSGWVLNHSGGVDIELEGTAAQVATFIADLQAKAPPLSHIESIEARPIDLQGYVGFEIRHSESQEGRYQLISPDVATCPDCLRELLDPADRRYRYPFTNCTNCGPRFTIIADIPYDRPNTTMRDFPMCPDCQAEYEDPANRRFHAQPNACPVCGPQVWLEEASERASEKAARRIAESGIGESSIKTPEAGNLKLEAGSWHPEAGIRLPASSIHHPPSSIQLGDNALARAAALLVDGRILAVKGLGGFQLACDATNPEAVARLRERKRRPAKPFALMVSTIEEARALCDVPSEAEALLTSPESPIVLLDARPDAAIATGVSPNSDTLGVMLPYTPLHHILLRDVGRPLVMTSGNLSEEPIAKDNDEALRRLAPLADAFLLHNRDIQARYDDSVVQLSESRIGEPANQECGTEEPSAGTKPPASVTQQPAFRIQFVRRARGYAPFPIRLPFKGPQIYAVGPLLKNTFALLRDDYAFVSQHIGDLENLETLEHYEAALATYQRLFRIEPEYVVCDLHPDYMSTRLATAFALEHGLPAPRRVQHHEAHIAACLADNGRPGYSDPVKDSDPVIGVALDGTGYGTDGAIWGGEWMVGGYAGFQRVAQLEYLPLPGGDAAIHHPWRVAAAYLHALGMDERLPLGQFCPADVMRVRTMVDRAVNTPRTSSMGRLFDAVSALLGICHEATYEAQAAIELEQSVPVAWTRADPGLSPYPYSVDAAVSPLIPDTRFLGSVIPLSPLQIRLARLFDAILDDLEREVSTAEIAMRFHVTVADMVVSVTGLVRETTGSTTVALSGGVFQNRLLLALTVPRLVGAGFEVLTHRHVPPNDGGISLGQAAMVAFEYSR